MMQTNVSDEADFSLLFETYKEQVYGYVLTVVKLSQVAEEITQDIFIKLWTCRDMLGDIKNLDGYIYILSRNHALNSLRQVKYDERLFEELRTTISEQHHPLEEYLLDRDYQQLLSDALNTLSPQRKIVYQLSREEGLSINEIAIRLQLSPNTVKNHLVASLKNIRQYLEGCGDITLLLTFFMFL